MSYKTLIIINPNSGDKNIKLSKKKIEKQIDLSVFNYTIALTEYNGHAFELAKNALISKIQVVIVAGGDGTINEVVKGLQNTNVKIGIIPIGSGNGLARELKIPLKIEAAIRIINKMKSRKIDLINLGNYISVNVAGVGFDAYIANLFNTSQKRGAWTYVKMTIAEYLKYHPKNYTITYEKQQIKTSAFLIAIANTRQFGNNAFIAPQAKDNDGLINICILKPFPLILVPYIALRIFNKTIERSKYYESFKTKEVKIESDELTIGHADGEIIKLNASIKATINKEAIKLIVP